MKAVHTDAIEAFMKEHGILLYKEVNIMGTNSTAEDMMIDIGKK